MREIYNLMDSQPWRISRASSKYDGEPLASPEFRELWMLATAIAYKDFASADVELPGAMDGERIQSRLRYVGAGERGFALERGWQSLHDALSKVARRRTDMLPPIMIERNNERQQQYLEDLVGDEEKFHKSLASLYKLPVSSRPCLIYGETRLHVRLTTGYRATRICRRRGKAVVGLLRQATRT